MKKWVVTIGNFDGVHLGHQEILRVTRTQAQRAGADWGVFTFRPHPQIALRPELQLKLLQTYDEKIQILKEMGVPRVIEQPFSREFSTTSSERFFQDTLVKSLGATAIVVGYDFAFGKGRAGGLERLGELCAAAGVELTVVPALRLNGEAVSSSRIRRLLEAGDVETAAQLLGRCFYYQGVVIRGDSRGRKIGFPTLNLMPGEKLHLPNGVYATWTWINQKRYPSVTNIGVRPTFAKEGQPAPVIIETHVLDASGDWYGEPVRTEAVKKLRDEKKFSGVDELRTQIQKDIDQARQILGA
ncbi:MAG: bifunctional riboflavin kinase/FAD synthetase [Bdellovibrionales bacterium]|nr:bifunctional riboflavin kinase/FAD synthetase [Bdellovibrionales bacterium]